MVLFTNENIFHVKTLTFNHDNDSLCFAAKHLTLGLVEGLKLN